MASGQNDTRVTKRPPQHAGVKRTRAREHHKSTRLEESPHKAPVPAAGRRQGHHHDSNTGARREKCAEDRHIPALRKRPRAPPDATTPEEPSHQRCKRLRRSAEVNTSALASPGNLGEDAQHPIAYWAANKRWPRQYFEQGKGMENILARKRSISARSRKNSDTGSTAPSSANQGESRSREQKSAEYRKPQYATVLATKDVFMERSTIGVTDLSKKLCRELFMKKQTTPQNTLFDDDIFEKTCKMVQDRNEAKIIQDITRLITPSAQALAIRDEKLQKALIESVNEGWNNSIPITKTRPQPDYAVGFRREAFKQEQLDRMHPIIGDFNDQSYFMAAWYMYFPFLTCEVKCGAAALDIADRQNAHSAAIAVRAVVELFRAVKREKELHREILAFSISHDHRSVRIYGHYAEIVDLGTKYYRHPIRTFDFTELDGKEKWTAYKFTKNVYDNWVPKHFERICSAIDQIPADISFSVSQSELPCSEQSSGLSQDFSAQSIAPSSTGPTSAQGHDESQSSIIQDLAVTPGTSVTEGVFKRPRRESTRKGRS